MKDVYELKSYGPGGGKERRTANTVDLIANDHVNLYWDFCVGPRRMVSKARRKTHRGKFARPDYMVNLVS